MTNPTPLSPAALAVWEAFNQDEAGMFVDYGDKLAAALRAVVQELKYFGITEKNILAIAAELEAQ